MGDLNAAVEEGQRGVDLADERGVRVGAPGARADLATTLIERAAQGDLDRAGEVLDEAIAVSRELDLRAELVISLGTRARLHDLEGRTPERDADRADALEIAREIGASRFVGELEAEAATVT
jgi:hypothetical protein